MAQKAPGKHYGDGISLIEIMRKFPDNASAERWFTEKPLAGWRALFTLQHGAQGAVGKRLRYKDFVSETSQ